MHRSIRDIVWPAVLLLCCMPWALRAQDADALARQLSNPIASLTSAAAIQP